MTYSIVARDPETGALGVGVQSHYFAAGAVVPWAEAGVGAVATQSVADPGYGPRGLALMRDGISASDALARLVADDELEMLRQVAMVDAEGRTGVHTGAGCVQAAGHTGAGPVSAQGNMLLRDGTWDAMLAAFSSSGGDLAERILSALDAAEANGGDVRGRQSAAILVVDGERSEVPWDHVQINLRVDDHPQPLTELRRLVEFSRATSRMTGVFGSGLLFAPAIDESMHDALEAALADLGTAQQTLGDNREPTFWQAVLLAKAGRVDDAKARLHEAAATHAQWIDFVERLPAAGILPADDELIRNLTGS
jgi:uncharacterized Ntn-hydrolase superfamily protein